MKSRFLRALLLICCSTSSLWLTAQPSTLCIESVISVANGNTTLNCEAGGTLGVIKFTTTRVPTPHVYIVTDTEGNILKVSLNNTISFDGLNEGMMRVYAVSFLGQVLAVPGGNIFTDQLGSICYHLSANYIEITNVLPDAGLISLAPDGGDDIKLCLESSSPGPVAFQTTGVTGNYAYLITDADGNILAVTPNPSFDFTGYDIGQYQVYGLAYFGNLAAAAGLNVFTDDLSDGCFGITPGPINVEVLYPDGGQLKFLNTQDETIVVCDSPNDTASTMINYTAVNPIPVSFAYFLTDPAGTILAILDGSPLDADSALPYGESRIWGLSYMGDLLLTVGGNITDFPASSDCYDFSDNVLSVIRTLVDGGAVQFEGGGSSALVCGGDNAPDLLAFTHQTTAAAAGYGYVITNQQNEILVVLPTGNSLDFNLAQPGICRVWGLSYTGSVLAEPGDNAFDTALTDGCYELSFNFLEVTKESVDGGTVSAADGAKVLYTCPGDGAPDVVEFANTGATTGAYLYVITDQNNIILTSTTESQFDFDALGTGVSRVWGLAYTGVFFGTVGQNLTTAVLSNGCYDLSDDFLTVVRQKPDGGTVSIPSGEETVYTCPGDDMPDILTFDSLTAYPGAYVYLITDSQNNIVTSTDSDSFDFNDAGQGISRIWGLAYTGNLTLQAGQNAADIALSDDCYDLSDNFITVVRLQPDGGLVALEDGATTAYICPGDGLEDIISFVNATTYPGAYGYLVTDETNVVVGVADGGSFDFESIPVGSYRVWGIAYTGNLTAANGQDASTDALSDDCFDLSDNFISVIRVTPDGGSISSPEGDTLSLCVGDHLADVVHFVVTGASNSPYAYLVTDENGFLISPLLQDSFNFDNAIGGSYRVYGLAYTGALSFIPGDPVEEVVAANPECLDLSDNYLVVNLIRVDGSLIFTQTGEKEVVYVCAPDGNEDLISFFSGTVATDADYQFVITSETNTILGFINGNQQNFENTGLKRLRVWGMSYTGGFLAGIGDNITTTALSTGCYVLSNNYITIVRDIPEGGSITTVDGDTSLLLCIGATDGKLPMVTSSASQSGYVYLVMDTSNVILDIIGSDIIDFNVYDPGTYRIRGLSYTGELEVEAGMMLDESSVLATSCYDLSDNVVEVVRSFPVEGGALSTQSGKTTFYFCPDSGLDQVIVLSNDSQVEDDQYTYVITNAANQIIIPEIIGNIIDFEPAADGIYRVYGVSYNGEFVAGFGDNVLTDPISDNCYDPSSNFIEIIKFSPNIDTVKTSLDETEVAVIVGDGEPDVIDFVASGATPTPAVFVATDEDNKVMEVLTGSSMDFEGADPGICRIWGVSYTGNLTIQPGDDVTFIALSTECFDLSENYVSVFKLEARPSGELLDKPEQVSNDLKSARPFAEELEIAPNPAGQTANIAWEWPAQSGSGKLQVIDLSGKVLSTWTVDMTKGRNVFSVDVSGMRSGSYILRLETAEGIFLNRMIVARL